MATRPMSRQYPRTPTMAEVDYEVALQNRQREPWFDDLWYYNFAHRQYHDCLTEDQFIAAWKFIRARDEQKAAVMRNGFTPRREWVPLRLWGWLCRLGLYRFIRPRKE